VLYCFSNFRDLARGPDSFVSTIYAVNHVRYFPQLGDIGRIDGHTAKLAGEAEKMYSANFDDGNERNRDASFSWNICTTPTDTISNNR